MCGFVGVHICTTVLRLPDEQFISHATLAGARSRQKVMTTGKALPIGVMFEAGTLCHIPIDGKVKGMFYIHAVDLPRRFH
jgi:hypothetical protein